MKSYISRVNPKHFNRGGTFASFIITIPIIVVVLWAIVDLSRYAFMRSTMQTAIVDVVEAFRTDDALLLNHFDRNNNSEMNQIALMRRTLSDKYLSSPAYGVSQRQLTPIPVAGYGAQSGSAVVMGDLQYVAVLPPGTSAKFQFADGTEQWVNHSICCDPTVDNCPLELRRGEPTNPCGTDDYRTLVLRYPTEFVVASLPNGTQLFKSPIVAKTSVLARVASSSMTSAVDNNQ